MITYFEIHKPLRRPHGQLRRQPRRQGGKNGAVDMRKLDGVLQDVERFRINMKQFDGSKSVFRVGAVRGAMP
jgi:hypothetical protein